MSDRCNNCGEVRNPDGHCACPSSRAESSLAAPTGLGVNRVGTKILGLAWGEQDRPDAALLASVEEVRSFIVEEWIGDKDHPLVEDVMRELAAHDWSEDGRIQWEFEVGGISLQDVFDTTPNDKLTDGH